MKKSHLVLFVLSIFSFCLAQDPGIPDSMYVEIDNPTVPPGGKRVSFKIRFYTDNSGSGNGIAGFAVPLYLTNSNSAANPMLDTTIDSTFSNTAVSGFALRSVRVVTNNGNPSMFPLQYVLGAISLAPSGITAGTYDFAFIKINVLDTTTICIDTMTFQEQGLEIVTDSVFVYTPSWKKLCSSLTPPQVNDSLTIIAYSPVTLVVTDPKGDSIGLDTTGTRPDTIFNTILEGSSYDTTKDVSVPPDGEKDDVVRIPKPYVGEYNLRVIPTGTGYFSVGIRIDGSDQVLVADSIFIENPDTLFFFGATVYQTVRGDVNKDTRRNLIDIIFLVNYIFKGGPAPDPKELGNVNCSTGAPNLSDIIYMVNYVFKGGKAPCS